MLYGQDGNDRLYGGAGKDRLNGGAGEDRFVFDTALNASTNVDTITDFKYGEDKIKIQLKQSIFAKLKTGTLNAANFRASADESPAWKKQTPRMTPPTSNSSATRKWSLRSCVIWFQKSDLVPEDFVAELDFSTLELFPTDHISEDLQERREDIVWRVGWKDGQWCYIALLLEFQSKPDPLMALRLLVYAGLFLQTLVKSGKVAPGEPLPPVFPVVNQIPPAKRVVWICEPLKAVVVKQNY